MNSFGILHRTPSFKDHRHIILSLHWSAFTRYKRYSRVLTPGLYRNIKRLQNVTIASHLDQAVIKDTFELASIDEQKTGLSTAFGVSTEYLPNYAKQHVAAFH
jgi:hypothetical protein